MAILKLKFVILCSLLLTVISSSSASALPLLPDLEEPAPISVIAISIEEKEIADKEAEKILEARRIAAEKKRLEKLRKADLARTWAMVKPHGYYDNWYAWHQCTWYVASRINVSGYLGNADTWTRLGTVHGWRSGRPRPGAIGVAVHGMHVVLAEKVSKNHNQVYLSERNYDYMGSYRERWAPASDFYWYFK